jgi:hypothetical protein
MNKLLFLILLGATLLFNSCTKEECDPINNDPVEIVGFWEGTYKVDGNPALGEQYFNLLIKSDGTSTNEGKWYDDLVINVGTWTLSGTTITIQQDNVFGGAANPQILTATFDSVGGKLTNGDIQNQSGTNSGTFEAVKRR